MAVKVPLAVRVVPSLTWRAWLTPPPLGRRTAALDRDATSDLAPVTVGGLSGLAIGSGPLALALHGWGGRTAQMAPVARRLAAGGFRVVVPDLPGHAGGEPTDIKKAAAAVSAGVDQLGHPEVIVAHSFASMVLRVAGLTAPVVVLVAPLMRVSHALEVFSARLRLAPWASWRLGARLQAWDRGLWPVVDGITPGQFPGAELLIVHDPEDPDTPFAASAEIAALRPGTRIVATPGLGHGDVLAEPSVADEIATFAGSHAGISH